MDKLTDKQKKIICILILILLVGLTGNTNNVPDQFIDRIIKPIKGPNSITRIGEVIIFFGIYYTLKYINLIKENKLVKSRLRRIIVTLLLLGVGSKVQVYTTQFFKGFSKGVNSIYVYRENSSVMFNANDKFKNIEGELRIKNCSNKPQEFYIKVRVPKENQELIGESYITLVDKYKVNPKYEGRLNIYQELASNTKIEENSYYSSKAFEYILFDENDEVIFKGTADDYHFDRVMD